MNAHNWCGDVVDSFVDLEDFTNQLCSYTFEFRFLRNP